MACGVAVQEVVAAGGPVHGAVEGSQSVAPVPGGNSPDRPRPDPALRPALGDRDPVRVVAGHDRAVHRVVELHVLGARRGHLLADRRRALGHLEGLAPDRHPPPAAPVAIQLRVLRIDPLDVVVHLLADVAGDQRPGVVVAPADARPRPESRHREAGAVDSRGVLAQLPEDRGRALAGLRRPEEQRAAAPRAVAADGSAVGADPRQGQPPHDVAQRSCLDLALAGDPGQRARVANREPPLGPVRQPLPQDRPWRRVCLAAAHSGRGRVVLEEQVVPDCEPATRAEALGQMAQQRRVAELPGSALARELDIGEEHHHAHRVGRLPRLGHVAERVEDHRTARRVQHHLLHALVEPDAEGLELALDDRRKQRVLTRHVRRVVEVAPHRLVGGEDVLALELGDPPLSEEPDADAQEGALLRQLVARAVRERVAGAGLDVGDAVAVAVDRDLTRWHGGAAGRLHDRHRDDQHGARQRADQRRSPSAPHLPRYTGLRAQSSRSGSPKF